MIRRFGKFVKGERENFLDFAEFGQKKKAGLEKIVGVKRKPHEFKSLPHLNNFVKVL